MHVLHLQGNTQKKENTADILITFSKCRATNIILPEILIKINNDESGKLGSRPGKKVK
ncbi:MAG: hypothetical protein BWX96_00271 [Bacteroidetes bacterium ADurb.Bin145]|jgi:hypothetical protein|nr:MAG: hypothetical protein BWX96_00271 [Bacteroidetes bacterium ADurb.Bin145]